MKKFILNCIEKNNYNYIDIEFFINMFSLLMVIPVGALAVYFGSFILCILVGLMPPLLPEVITYFIKPSLKERFPYKSKKKK